jgi:hypothetical protein
LPKIRQKSCKAREEADDWILQNCYDVYHCSCNCSCKQKTVAFQELCIDAEVEAAEVEEAAAEEAVVISIAHSPIVADSMRMVAEVVGLPFYCFY